MHYGRVARIRSSICRQLNGIHSLENSIEPPCTASYAAGLVRNIWTNPVLVSGSSKDSARPSSKEGLTARLAAATEKVSATLAGMNGLLSACLRLTDWPIEWHSVGLLSGWLIGWLSD